MDLRKCYDFFQPESVKNRINIIGCGSVGSTLAENLVRCGVTKISLWDFDTVEAKNISNQMFFDSDIGKPKTEALRNVLVAINPELKDDIELYGKWNGEIMSGYIFLAVDDIDVRRNVVEKHFRSPYVKAIFDVRTALESAQHFAAEWSDIRQKQALLNSMQFSQEEGKSDTPMSACGETLGVVTTVRAVCSFAVSNFINYVKHGELHTVLEINPFNATVKVF